MSEFCYTGESHRIDGVLRSRAQVEQGAFSERRAAPSPGRPRPNQLDRLTAAKRACFGNFGPVRPQRF
jgi:hypothetical protein